MSPSTQALIEKIEALPADRLAEVEDFVDFIRSRDQDRQLSRAAVKASAKSFDSVWNNPEDDVYDSV
ncbi:MAG: toxin-antitoxin system, antitoxin component, Xre family protein [Alphaproteobacteria bacterium]|nr:toxin-antitoxin system, antitoxin component, Xre family protein [Alphaproteobacteria bacterium]